MTAREQAIEAMAAALHEAFRAAQQYPDDWPMWAQLVAEGHQGMHRVNDTRALATAALDALCALSREPGAAWRIVPSEATKAMKEAGFASWNAYKFWGDIYRSMLTAAQNPLEDAK